MVFSRRFFTFLLSLVSFILCNKSDLLYAQSIPQISINTENSIGEEFIKAHFILIEQKDTTVNEQIHIRIRGGSSRQFPKKSFRIEFRTGGENDTTKNVSLLNMRSDDDWNLNAIYNEPLRLQSKSAYEIWSQIQEDQTLPSGGKNGIDIQYVQVFINDEYQGIYILTERVDAKQLRLTSSGELYKTFDHSTAALFYGAKPYDNNNIFWDGIEWKYPEENIDWENLYQLVKYVSTAPKIDFYTNYSYFFDIQNLVDYFLFINLLSLHDNTGKNIYIARLDQQSPYFYVPWDLDGSFGFSWDGKFVVGTRDKLSNGLYNRLLEDCYANGFVENLKTRWEFLRKEIITPTNIYAIMDKNYFQLNQNNIYQLEKNRWDNYQFSYLTYESSKLWIKSRIEFLDQYFDSLCDGSATPVEDHSFQQIVSVYPNPAHHYFYLQLKNPDKKSTQVDIFHINGQHVWSGPVDQSIIIPTYNWSKGMYVVQIQQGENSTVQKLIIQ